MLSDFRFLLILVLSSIDRIISEIPPFIFDVFEIR